MDKKYSFLIETFIGIGMILFVNIMWSRHNMGFLGISPNPYWIVVVFIAVRYGSFQGFITGLLCSCALLISVSYNMALEQQFEFARVPSKQIQLSSLFVLLGFLIGEERARVNRILDSWRTQYNKLRNEFEALAMEHLSIKNIKSELEGRILGQSDTINTVYEIAKELVTLKAEQLYPSVVSLVEKFIEAEKCSFYIMEEGKFYLKGYRGWGDEINNRKVLDTHTDIIKKVISDKRTVTVTDLFRADNVKWEQDEDPVMVAPLFFGEEPDQVTGLILVDKIDFLKLNPNSVRFLTTMADWISKSFDNFYATTSVRKKDIFDDDLKLFTYNYVTRRIKEELVTTEASGRVSSFMLVKLNDFDVIEEEKRNHVLRAMGFVIGHTLRGSDIVAKYTKNDILMALLLGTDGPGAKIAGDRVKQQIEKFEFKPFGDAGKLLDVNVSTKELDPEHKSETEFLDGEDKVLM